MTAREHAEMAAVFLNMEVTDETEALAVNAAMAHAITALALTATDPGAGLVVYTREGS